MQVNFHESTEFEVLWGGEAGGGKSWSLALEATRYVAAGNYRAVIFRRTYPDLEDLIAEARQMYVPCGANFNESKHNFTWGNGSIIMFRHMQHLKDIYSHQGKQYDFIGFDELPQFPKLAYTYLFSRCRGVNPNIVRRIRSTANPDGEGLLWVKNRFIDPMNPLETAHFLTDDAGRDVKVPEGTKDCVSRMFIPCIRSENRVLMDNDPGYEARLNQLPPEKKRALKYGIWTLKDKPGQLIKSEWWEKALKGGNGFKNNGKYTVGGDFATHQGEDKSVEFFGIGNRPFRCRVWDKTKTDEFAQILAETASLVDRPNIMIGVDSIGPGVGVADALETHHGCADILDRCNHKDPRFDAKYEGDMKFDNLRSQMCWKFSKDMEEGNIDLSAFQMRTDNDIKEDENDPDGYFEDFNKLQEETLYHTYRVFNGKLIVIPKIELKKAELLGRSPDFFDALVIWNWTRRHHYEAGHDLDGEYQADDYMETWFRKEQEYEEGEDEGAYAHEDDGDYENDY